MLIVLRAKIALNVWCRVLIASIMEEYNKGAWEELIERCEGSGVDAFEINFSCPHGMPERKMGMAMGQDPEILQVRNYVSLLRIAVLQDDSGWLCKKCDHKGRGLGCGSKF